MKQTTNIKEIAQLAFVEGDEIALLDVHRYLYKLNLSCIDRPWDMSEEVVKNDFVIKHYLEDLWHQSENIRLAEYLQKPTTKIPTASNIVKTVREHQSNELHPIFSFLADDAKQSQLREFIYQETPLEVLFADILAFMLPGIYGGIKLELVKNYWDELGHAKENKSHRNLRLKLMRALEIKENNYSEQINSFIREELELINYYFSLATNRFRQTELVGVMLATELAIPGRFSSLVLGLERIGIGDDALTYLTEHITVDKHHADDWLQHVVMPILNENQHAITPIMRGVQRRLTLAENVLDKLYDKIRSSR